MRRRILFVSALLLVAAGLWVAGALGVFRTSPPDASMPIPPTAFDTSDPAFLGVFEGRVPCADCERVKVALILYWDPVTHAPTTYVLERINVGQGDDRHVAEGSWSIIQGTASDPGAVVYRLGDDAPPGYRLYQAVDENLLLFLGDDLRLKVGDAGHSYTLSRTH